MTWYRSCKNGVAYADTEKHCPDCTTLVVIDPEDREAVERLARRVVIYQRSLDLALPFHSLADIMQDALREFANPTPPKPEEPLGLGAVVEDAGGRRWIRIDEHMDCNDWTSLGAKSHKPYGEDETIRHFYRDIAVVRVLSPGYTED